MNELYLLAEQSEVQALFVFPRPVAFKRLLRAVDSFETGRVLFKTWVCAELKSTCSERHFSALNRLNLSLTLA